MNPSFISAPEVKPFWAGLLRHEMWLPRCTACGTVRYPPRAFCPRCFSNATEWVRCSGCGVVYSYVVTYQPATAPPGESWEVMAVVELEEGPRVLAPVVGLKEAAAVKVGMAVRLASSGDGRGGPAFEPA
ncbi:MAG: Zn-ribbon domain-containing OB-fold protein [Chloroflexi bacterium]|nr:Zn-ribbon domain-containing OB-fold protein [Chloroflexota bacterium]